CKSRVEAGRGRYPISANLRLDVAPRRGKRQERKDRQEQALSCGPVEIKCLSLELILNAYVILSGDSLQRVGRNPPDLSGGGTGNQGSGPSCVVFSCFLGVLGVLAFRSSGSRQED